MKWLTISDIKKQLRVDFDDEDGVLDLYGSAAEDTVLNYLNRTYQDVLEEYGEVPPAIRQATLMLVDKSYQHRSPAEPTQMYYVLYGFDVLVKPYMRLTDSVIANIQKVTLGSDVKIAFSAELPNNLTMKDVPFSVTVYNADDKKREVIANKDDCIIIDDNEYVVLVNTDELGVGLYMLKVTFEIPDTDYPTGYFRQVVRINPNIECNG